VLAYVVEFGPAVFALGVLSVVFLIFDRQRSARWLRFQTWLKTGPQTQRNLLQACYFIAFGLLLAFGSFLAPRLTGKPPIPPLGYAYWIFWGVLMAVVMPITNEFFKGPKEPEDWLLWDKEDAEPHAAPPARPHRASRRGGLV
jgi:hypothetical protein